MRKRLYLVGLSLSLLLTGCDTSTNSSTPSEELLEVTYKTISKDEYKNKTLGGLLGQFAGFLSGYEFVWEGGGLPRVGLPLEWFQFLNGPYAGNYEYYYPGAYAEQGKYDRLRVNPETGLNEVWSDDDFHIDIFNQTTFDEYGFTAKDLKDSWKDYSVNDWGGGNDAMRLINSHDLLSPYTGTIESGNRFGWCTEAYIENETLGMNAAGMPNAAIALADTFASNTGYFDSVIWAKYFAALYSMAYFESDINILLKEAHKVLPKGSGPEIMANAAFEAYKLYPNAESQYKDAGLYIESIGRQLYRMDNIQTNPGINGGFAVLSWLYAQDSYMDGCMYSSMLGYDGDCTSATVTGLLGIINGFKPGNEEYEQLNNTIYYDGEGVYFNDSITGFDPFISSSSYPERQKIDDIVDKFASNFEKFLLLNGGRIEGDSYVIPTTKIYSDTSLLFENYDGELRDTTGFTSSNGTFENIVESDLVNVHSGVSAFKLENTSNGEVYHTFKDLEKGAMYRLSTFVKTSDDTVVEIFARDGNDIQAVSFGRTNTIMNKDFLFKATSSSMDVGFKFGIGSKTGDTIFFDDFMVEKIRHKSYSFEALDNINIASNKYVKFLNRPTDESVTDKQEFYLRIAYSSANKQTLFVKIKRNNVVYGGAVAPTTGLSVVSGYDYLEIPYVFENASDTIELSFEGNTLGIRSIELIRKDSYLFR